jgi:ketosteroid isomerase-like protein
MDNASIVRRWFEEVWNQGREPTIDELMAPDAVTHGLYDAAQTHRGPTAFKPFWAQLRRAFPDIHFTIDDAVSEGNMVAARWTARMTHRGEYLGGRHAEAANADRDGLRAHRRRQDSGRLEQLGSAHGYTRAWAAPTMSGARIAKRHRSSAWVLKSASSKISTVSSLA